MHDKVISPELVARIQTEAPWLKIALGETPAAELKGLDENNPKILKYISSFPNLMTVDYKIMDHKTHKMVPSGWKMGEVDETPWCSCFVAWCLRTAGNPVFGVSAGAKSWLKFGMPLSEPRLGAITVVFKKHAHASITSSGYHVAFYLDGKHDKFRLVGGNQGDRVCAKEFHGWKVMGYRWPGTTIGVGVLPSNIA